MRPKNCLTDYKPVGSLIVFHKLSAHGFILIAGISLPQNLTLALENLLGPLTFRKFGY